MRHLLTRPHQDDRAIANSADLQPNDLKCVRVLIKSDSAIRDVQPIHAVDGQPLPDCPGPLTKAAAGAYAALLAADPDPQ